MLSHFALLAWFFAVPSLLFAEMAKILVSAPSRSLTWFPAFLAREQGFYRAGNYGLKRNLRPHHDKINVQPFSAGSRRRSGNLRFAVKSHRVVIKDLSLLNFCQIRSFEEFIGCVIPTFAMREIRGK